MIAIVLISAAVIGAVCGLTSAVTMGGMVQAVNAHLPQHQQYSELGWPPGKFGDVMRAYRRLYPDGPLARRQVVLIAIMAVAAACAFIAILTA